jgi:C4-dicarboxylate transporter, DctM subunit
MMLPLSLAVAVLLLLFGAPLFLVIIAPTITAFEIGPATATIPSMVLPQRMVDGINKFSLLAVPLFIFAADVIARGQIGGRLVRMLESFVGHRRGGLAIATVAACALFGAMSGIGQAAILSIGPIVYPALLRQGYSAGFSVGLIVASSTLAMLIPPGVAMILYALQTNSSVGAVFMAGLGSGAFFALVLAAYAYIYAVRHGIGHLPRVAWRERWSATKEAGWALGLPAIILGGIYLGFFTPTEAAAFACVYAICIEYFVYRSMTLGGLLRISSASTVTISILLLLVAMGTALTYVLTLAQVPQMVASTFGESSSYVLLLIVNIVFLVTGMFVDPNSAIIIMTPIIYQAAMMVGVDPVHLGIVVVANLAIGMVSPPFGINIFVAMTVFRVPYAAIVRALLPFIALMLLVLGVITYIPAVSLLLPRMLM